MTPKTIKFNGTNLGNIALWNIRFTALYWFPEILLVKLYTNSLFWKKNILPSCERKSTSLVDILQRRSYNSLRSTQPSAKCSTIIQSESCCQTENNAKIAKPSLCEQSSRFAVTVPKPDLRQLTPILQRNDH